MSKKSVTVVYYWGGVVCENGDTSTYEGGKKGCLRPRVGMRYNYFVDRIYSCTGHTKESHSVKMTCKYPTFISPNRVTYIDLPIFDNDTLDAMLSVVSNSEFLQSIDLYVEFDLLDNPMVSSPNLDSDSFPSHNLNLNEYPSTSEFGRVSQTPFEAVQYPSTSEVDRVPQTPLEAVQNVVMTENAIAGCYARGSDDAEEETIVEEDEDEIIEQIDNPEEGGSDDDTDEGDDAEGAGLAVSTPRLHQADSQFFSNFEASGPYDYAPAGIISPSIYDGQKDDLRRGLLFKTKELLKLAVSNYHIKRQKEYRVGTTNKTSWEAHCKNKDATDCEWKLRGSLQKKHGLFEIVTYVGPHTCLFPQVKQGHPQINAELIGSLINIFVKEDPSMKVQTIRTLVWSTYNYGISYFKAWYAKQKVIAQIFGDWEKSYQRLPKFMAALQKYNPGTIVEYDTQLTNNPNEVVFQRMFWSFKPCIDAFVHCRPVVCVDATHLYDKYKGKLLIAIGIDANRNILPLAFAFAEEETANNWGWFLRLLRRRCVGEQRPVCLISDRHAGILGAVRREANGWLPPYGFHRYCLRHLISNFMTKFKNNTLKKLVWEAALQTQQRKFTESMEQIRDINQLAYDWLNRIPLETWSFYHDGGKRWGEKTTNVVECFNGVLKGARSLPITACVQIIFYRAVRYFELRREDGARLLLAGVQFTTDASARIQRYQEFAGSHYVTGFNRTTGEASVTSRRGNPQVVIIRDMFCTCGKWATFKLPCSHALAVCRRNSLDSDLLVDAAFRVATHVLTYTPEFHPLYHENYWDEVPGPIWIPNNTTMRTGGRPRSNRFHNEMDVRSTNLCGLCRVPGHSRRTCPTRGGHASASRHL